MFNVRGFMTMNDLYTLEAFNVTFVVCGDNTELTVTNLLFYYKNIISAKVDFIVEFEHPSYGAELLYDYFANYSQDPLFYIFFKVLNHNTEEWDLIDNQFSNAIGPQKFMLNPSYYDSSNNNMTKFSILTRERLLQKNREIYPAKIFFLTKSRLIWYK